MSIKKKLELEYYFLKFNLSDYRDTIDNLLKIDDEIKDYFKGLVTSKEDEEEYYFIQQGEVIELDKDKILEIIEELVELCY